MTKIFLNVTFLHEGIPTIIKVIELNGNKTAITPINESQLIKHELSAPAIPKSYHHYLLYTNA